jgi:hypothetical protein
MSKYLAIPLRDDGTERLGTEGVLSGQYDSTVAFLRYCVRRYAQPGTVYVIYRLDDQGKRHRIGPYEAPTR